jgi:hypothetical protein
VTRRAGSVRVIMNLNLTYCWRAAGSGLPARTWRCAWRGAGRTGARLRSCGRRGRQGRRPAGLREPAGPVVGPGPSSAGINPLVRLRSNPHVDGYATTHALRILPFGLARGSGSTGWPGLSPLTRRRMLIAERTRSERSLPGRPSRVGVPGHAGTCEGTESPPSVRRSRTSIPNEPRQLRKLDCSVRGGMIRWLSDQPPERAVAASGHQSALTLPGLLRRSWTRRTRPLRARHGGKD